MHYTGTIWRPPYEADSLILEATAGCTHHRCKFCTLYEELPFKFRMAKLEHIKQDLIEAQTWYHSPRRKGESRLFNLPQPRRCRVFLAGANPFALNTPRLFKIAGLIQKHFPSCHSIGCFARITDVALKSDDELAALAYAGYDELTIGVETGDAQALAFMDKGYTPADIVEQCRRLDAAGMRYAFFYLAGISGRGRGLEGARASAEAFNQTHPWLIGVNMLTVYRNSRLYSEIHAGAWAEETEVEKYQEIRELVENLTIPVQIALMGASNPVQLAGRLPEQRAQLVDTLDRIASDIGEGALREYRTSLKHL